MKVAFAGLVGLPNAGKSTLLNLLVGEKIAATSHKPQTTRTRVSGIYNSEGVQIIFLDSPGFIEEESGLHDFMVLEAKDVFSSVDVALLVVSSDMSITRVDELVGHLPDRKTPLILVLSKRELVKDTTSLKKEISERIQNAGNTLKDTIEISAMKEPEKTKEKILHCLNPFLMLERAALYPTDEFTSETVRNISAEFIREACFQHLHQEVPYQLAVQIKEFTEKKDITVIKANLIVEKDGQKIIVVGSGGSMIKAIGVEAREKIEKLIHRKVFLDLNVEVKANWTSDKKFLRELGYVRRDD